tara:strand:+ start:6021 stop:6764 length:744 start_codon:yes stop_codon:yes gene_type:complete
MLKNKLALITGCNKGIGLKTLEIFSQNGADIFACVRNINEDFLEKIQKLQSKYKNKIVPLNVDLNNKETIKLAINKINSYEKNLNIMVNNAAIIHNKLFQLTKIDEIYETFEVNFFNQIFFTQGLLRNIIKTNNGSIIFLSSSAAKDGNIGRAAYAASKAALSTFSKVLSREVGRYNLRVNTISPGLTNTEMMTSSTDENYLKNIIKEISLKKIAEPVDISNLILFLASDLSNYLTGQDIRIDGGLR